MEYSKLIELYVGRIVDFETDVICKEINGIWEICKWNIPDKSKPTIEDLKNLENKLEIVENNKKIKSEILELENKQPRAIREFILQYDCSKKYIKDIDDKIIELRSKLL